MRYYEEEEEEIEEEESNTSSQVSLFSVRVQHSVHLALFSVRVMSAYNVKSAHPHLERDKSFCCRLKVTDIL